jgi:hypothetical protein
MARPQRDRFGETLAAKRRRCDTLLELRNAREQKQNLIFLSRYLVAMSLPYAPTSERQIRKSARLGPVFKVQKPK